MTTDRSRRVIMLIDYDNLQICASRDAPGTDLDLHAVMELAQSYGTVVVARAYAEWNMAAERLAVYKAGIEPIFAPVLRTDSRGRVEGKSLCDTVMVAEGVDLLWTLQPDVLVLVTSDKDLIPLARVARQRGASVVVIGSDLTAVQLVEMCNVLITYRQLLKDLGKSADAAPPSTPSRGDRTRGRGIAERNGADRDRDRDQNRDREQSRDRDQNRDRERERPVRSRDRDRDRDRDREVAPAEPVAVAEPVAFDMVPPDESEQIDALTAEEVASAARRRRRRRGRSRTEDGVGTDGATDSMDDAVETNGDSAGPVVAEELAPADMVEPPVFNGLVEAADVPPSEEAPPARAPRRRRRTPAAAAATDEPAEPVALES